MARPFSPRSDFSLEITALTRARHVILYSKREPIMWRKQIAAELQEIIGKLMASDEKNIASKRPA